MAKKEEIKDLVQTGDIRNQNIVEELTSSYINYAMSVIVSRALPDAHDGLKPVQRRILYAMHEMGVKPGSPFKKVARIVGEVVGKYHPHGTAAVEDALVRLGQWWNMRYKLVQGQGNFGSIDGDPHAAMRYIEARLAHNSSPMLEGLEENTVDFAPNYDGLEYEPVVLPALLPNLIINGAEGIAVGMATKIPPHNLGEVVDAITELVNNGTSQYEETDASSFNYDKDIKTVADLENLPKDRFPVFQSESTIEQLLKHIKGPDFPTGAEIYDKKEINKVYETGKGRILMRGVSAIEETKGNKFQIVITEVPYQVNKQRLIAKIAELVKDGKIKGIADIKDLSNKEGIRVVIELKRDAKPKTVQNLLYKYTEMQKAFNANMLALVENEPTVMNIKQILGEYIKHRQSVVIRKHEYELAKKREREHILEGLMIALENLDEVINTIRNSKDTETARNALMSKFQLTEVQATAILDMQLRRLAALERQKIEEEYKQTVERIKEILKMLGNPQEVLDIIVSELQKLKDNYADKRRTRVYKGKADELTEEDLIAKEDVIVTISEQGYIKRIKDTSYSTQGRGGVGKKAMTTKDDDTVRHVFNCTTHDEVLFFTNRGRVFNLKVHEIPEYTSRAAKGVPAINLINIEQEELITSVLNRSSEGYIVDEDVLQEGEEKTEHQGKDYKYLFMATKAGIVKKTELEEFSNVRANGLIAINLEQGDELTWVRPTTGEDNVILVTSKGKSIHFKEEDVRETGRATRGVKGINLSKEDFIISMDVVRNTENYLLTLSKKGFGKITKLNQYSPQKRGGNGIFAARVNDKTGDIAAARLLDHPDRELLIMSAHGQAVRVPTKELPERNRQTAGVRMMKLKSQDYIAAIAVL